MVDRERGRFIPARWRVRLLLGTLAVTHVSAFVLGASTGPDSSQLKDGDGNVIGLTVTGSEGYTMRLQPTVPDKKTTVRLTPSGTTESARSNGISAAVARLSASCPIESVNPVKIGEGPQSNDGSAKAIVVFDATVASADCVKKLS